MLAVAHPLRFGRLPLPISYLSPAVFQEPSPGRVKSTDAAVSEWSRALRELSRRKLVCELDEG